MVRESLEQYQSTKQLVNNSVKQDKENDKKKEVKQDSKVMKEKTEKKADILLPKKRESNKKGLSL